MSQSHVIKQAAQQAPNHTVGKDPVLCRKLLLGSLAGIVVALLLLGTSFRLSESHTSFVVKSSCPTPGIITCTACIQHVSLLAASLPSNLKPGAVHSYAVRSLFHLIPPACSGLQIYIYSKVNEEPYSSSFSMAYTCRIQYWRPEQRLR